MDYINSWVTSFRGLFISNPPKESSENVFRTKDLKGVTEQIKTHIKKGDTRFELDFDEQTLDKYRIDDITSGFTNEKLPENIDVAFYFNNCNLDDDSAKQITDRLSSIEWPKGADLKLFVRTNMICEDGLIKLVELCNKIAKVPEARIVVDLDNNNGFKYSAIEDTLENIENSKLIDKTVTNEKNVKVCFSGYLVKEHLSNLN